MRHFRPPAAPKTKPAPAPAPAHVRPLPRERGVAAIIAMMFLVIFGSLAAAMAIVSQGGLRSAESHLKISRAHAAAETGLDLLEWRLAQAFAGRTTDPVSDASLNLTAVRSDRGIVSPALAGEFWNQASANLAQIMAADSPLGGNQNQSAVRSDFTNANGINRRELTIGPIRVGPGQPDFVATLRPHPLVDEDYSSVEYDRLPYGPPAGRADGTPAQRIAFERDMAIKRAAGIEFIVGTPGEPNRLPGFVYQPLDARFIRLSVTGTDRGTFNASEGNAQRELSREGAAHSVIERTITQDYRLSKTIPFAVLSRSRVMIGRNVTIDGAINSRFSEVNLDRGHPIQMESDFLGFDPGLDADLADLATAFSNNGVGHDLNNDNRLDLSSPSETAGLWPIGNETARLRFIEQNDLDNDGFLTEFDYFVRAFDGQNGGDLDGGITREEFGVGSGAALDRSRAQLFELINVDASPATFIDANGVRRPILVSENGVQKDVLNRDDEYAKIRGQVLLEATIADWEAGAASAGGSFHDFLQGPISADFGTESLVAGDDETDALYEFGADSFDMTQYHNAASNVLDPANPGSVTANDPSEPTEFNGRQVDGDGNPIFEDVPFQSGIQAYDHFDRPVYRNLRFVNARIPPGTNALFENCLFLGVTYVETAPDNTDPNFNFAGIQDANGVPEFWDRPVEIGGVRFGGDGTEAGDQIEGTKLIANNIRFHNCTFEGPLAGGPVGGGRFSSNYEFTHTRNKITFTGRTRWNVDESTVPDADELEFFRRSSLLMPHFSVELGSFKDAESLEDEVALEGTVVAGIIDIRGEAIVEGTIVTTFEPQSDTGPVVGDTSPNFNTTLGYFGRDEGDLESNRDENVGLGRVRLRYDPLATLPDGITSPITLAPLARTFSE